MVFIRFQRLQSSKILYLLGFGAMEAPKPIKYKGLGPWRRQNLSNTIFWSLEGAKILQIQRFGALGAPKPYKYNGLGPWGRQNVTNIWVWGPGWPGGGRDHFLFIFASFSYHFHFIFVNIWSAGFSLAFARHPAPPAMGAPKPYKYKGLGP